MALTIQQIITEADILVPNVLSTADKVLQLNQINQDFFNIVKIPKVSSFTTTVSSSYTLPNVVRSKNIDYVKVGVLKYRDQLTDAVSPLQNVFTYDDDTHTLTLSPAPYQSGLPGIVRYHRIATTTFTPSVLSTVPDAPEEYHWTFIPALASWMANTLDDTVKGAFYEVQYRDAWNSAAAGYQKEALK